MPYREKIAWLSLVAMVVTFGPYFAMIHSGALRPGPVPDFYQLKVLALVTISQALLLGLGHLVLRRAAPDDARTPPDERDHAITRLSITWAYYVLISGMIMVGCIMPFTDGGWTIVHAALFMIVLAEVVHYGVIVVSYRRQA